MHPQHQYKNAETQYLMHMSDIIRHGKHNYPTRKNYATGEFTELKDGGNIALFGLTIVHDMSVGFPILTSKKMATKSCLVELEGFTKGITSKAWYQENGCNIWNEWANPQVIANRQLRTGESEREAAYAIDDLGPIYGAQWRAWDAAFTSLHSTKSIIDQFTEVLKTLRNSPHDRRMVVSAWNPRDFHRMALVPCHMIWQVVVIDDELHLEWAQRSCDWALGVPYNIMSYGTLLLLLAAWAGKRPGFLKGNFTHSHLYYNQIDAAKEQTTRKVYSPPTARVSSSLLYKWSLSDYEPSSFFEWTYRDIVIENYQHAGILKYPPPVV